MEGGEMRIVSMQKAVAVVLLCAVVLCPRPGLAQGDKSMSEIVQASNAFAVEMYKQIKSE